MPNLKNRQRPIDKIAKQSYSWWGRSFVFIRKAEVKTWQAIFIIAFISGVCATLIWTISNNFHPYSSAATDISVNRLTPNIQNARVMPINDLATGTPPDISFLTPAQVKSLADLYGKKVNKTKLKSNDTQETADLNATLKKYNVPDSVKAELDNINSKSLTWTANFNSIFVKSEKYKKNLLGVKPDEKISNLLKSAPPVKNPSQSAATLMSAGPPVDNFRDFSLPTSFDWRNVGGKNYITSIKDQANCSSCWAFATAATLEGNINAYFNNPAISQDLSEQDLVSCYLPGSCTTGAGADQIGQLFSTYLPSTGITQDTCMPYTASDESCSLKCSDWQSQKWKTDSSYHSITPTIDNIKSALVNYGPVEVGMVVYSDLFSYSGGIYVNATNDIAGYHAVTIVGYGNENNKPYWIVKNSWGTGWGESGYFKIAAGNSMIDQWFAYAPGIPYYNTANTKLCTDTDKDGYCYWGLGAKPTSGCPLSCADVAAIEDCNDSNPLLHSGCQATASTLTVNLPSITGFKAMVSINGGVATQYTAPISLRAGDTFTVTPSPVTGYNPVTSGICSLASPGVGAGVTYVCNIIYSTLTINLPSITGAKAMVSINGGVATQYTAPIVLRIGDTFAVTPSPVTGYYPATFGNCSLGSPGASAGRQYVCTVNYDIFPWSETRPAGDNNENWRALAMSADGSHLVAGIEMGYDENINKGRLYLSSDFGATWRETRPAGDSDKYWQGAAMNADGSRLIVGAGGSSLYISSDFGTTWRETRPAGNRYTDWYALASSADGSHLIAGAGSSGPGRLYISADYGATWKETRPFGDSDESWEVVASSADGSHLIAGAYTGNGHLYISSDYGATWREVMPAGDPNAAHYDPAVGHDVVDRYINWFGAAISADGSHLMAGVAGWEPGRLYISSDFGATWRETRPAGDSNHSWFGIASDADGSNLIAGIGGAIGGGVQAGRLYISSDYGATWRETRPLGDAVGSWTKVASNADGSRLMAGSLTRRLYIATPPPPSVTVLSPNGGETYKTGVPVTIKWQSLGSLSSTVLLEIRKGTSPYIMIYSAAPNTGSYTYPFPSSMAGGNNWKIRVTDQNNRSIYDESNAPFTVASSTGVTGWGN